MSGRADENDRCVFGAYPGPLKDVFGVWVEETDALYPEETIEIIMTGKEGDCSERQHTGKFLCDLFHAQTAEVLAVYGKSFAGEKEQECFYTGMPALTVNKYGEGHAYYLGCEPDESFMRQWILKLCEETGVKRRFAFEGKLELTCRENENESCFPHPFSVWASDVEAAGDFTVHHIVDLVLLRLHVHLHAL